LFLIGARCNDKNKYPKITVQYQKANGKAKINKQQEKMFSAKNSRKSDGFKQKQSFPKAKNPSQPNADANVPSRKQFVSKSFGKEL